MTGKSHFFHFFQEEWNLLNLLVPALTLTYKAKPDHLLQRKHSLLSMSHLQRRQSVQKSWAKKCRHDKFCEGWLKNFSWFETDQEMTVFCSICLKTRQKNGFTRGSRNYQYSVLTEHAKSISQKAATCMVPHSESACACEKECLQAWESLCQDPAGNQTTRRPPDHNKEMQTAVVWSCLPFIRYRERGTKTRPTEDEVGRQHQGMDWLGVWQVPEGSGDGGNWLWSHLWCPNNPLG